MSNRFYDHTTFPVQNSLASSSGLRAELDLVEAGFTAVEEEIDGKAASSHTHADATTLVAGFMSAADKTKLNGVATSANNYSHPTGDGNLHVPATSTTNNGKVLKAGSTAGSLSWGTLSYTDVGAAAASHTHNYAGSASAGGAAASVAQILTRGTGLTGNNFNGSAATTWAVSYGTAAGTACQGNDARLSDSRPASDVYAWAKASVKPSYTAAEVGAAASSHTHGYLPLSGGALTGDLVFGESDRDHSPMGTYNPAKTQQIWSMGTAYRNSATGVDFGSLYGLAYKHTNNATGGTMAGGHQMVWVQAGVPKCALGDNIWTSGNVTAYSDIRVKTNLEVIPNALDKVQRLNGYTFERTDVVCDENGRSTGPLRQTGVVAQEVIKVLPEAVMGGPTENDPDGHYSVAYGNLVGLLIEAIKEQQRSIEVTAARIDLLESREC